MLNEVATVDFFEEFRDYAERSQFTKPLRLVSHSVELTNPVCGDEVEVFVLLEDNLLTGYAYHQRGCWPVKGCLELLGELALGCSSDRILTFSLEEFFLSVRGVPVSKRHAFSLTHRALKEALLGCLAKQ